MAKLTSQQIAQTFNLPTEQALKASELINNLPDNQNASFATLPTLDQTASTNPSDSSLLEQPQDNLSTFKDAVAKTLDLAKQHRNEFAQSFMNTPGFKGTVAASDFNSLFSNFNSAQDTYGKQVAEKILPSKLDTSVIDYGGGKALINNQSGEIIKTYGSGQNTVANGEGGQALLDSLDPATAALVKKIANYEADISKVTSLKGGEREKIASLVSQYDPTFDMTQYGARASLRKDFNTGKSAQNIRSLNTAIGHLDTLSSAAKDLDNRALPLWNSIGNLGLNAVGDPRVTKFNTAANAVESELAAVFKGTGASDQEIKTWRNAINSSQSPDQLKAGIDTAIELLGSRLQALTSQYETGLGKPKDFRFLNDKSVEILQGLGVDVNSIDPLRNGVQNDTGQSSEIKTITDPQTKQNIQYKKVEGGWQRVQDNEVKGFFDSNPIHVKVPELNSDQFPDAQQIKKIDIPTTSKLSYENNNPGNLKFAGQDGATKGTKGFARFATTTDGFNALVDQIKLDASRGLTIEKFINKFAPAVENDVKTYTNFVTKQLGVSKKTKIADIDPHEVARVIALFESGAKIL